MPYNKIKVTNTWMSRDTVLLVYSILLYCIWRAKQIWIKLRMESWGALNSDNSQYAYGKLCIRVEGEILVLILESYTKFNKH